MVTLTWNQYHADTLQLAKNLGDYRPDVIVPCMLGGFFPGMILPKELGINDVRPIDIEREDEVRRLAYDVQGSIKGKKVLLLEDDLPTGKGPVIVKRIFEERGAEVKIAAVYVTNETESIVDFYGKVCEKLPDYPYKKSHTGDRLRR